LSETPVEYRRAPPMLGEHSQQVLQDWLGGEASGETGLGAPG